MPPDIVFRPPPHLIDAHFSLIEGLIHAGILEPPVVPLRRCILNHYFLLLKTNGVVRLIFNGTRVNRCLPRPPPFSMTNVSHISSDIAQQEHTHASELDLFSAFYQIPVYPSFRRFLCIATPTHGVLQFTRLPMGMSWASFCLHKAVTSTVLTSPFPQSTHSYADSIYPFGPSAGATLERLSAIHKHFVDHNWVLNHDKMRLPFSAGDVLGIFLDLKHRCTEPTADFRRTLGAAASAVLSKPTRHNAQRLLGCTVWAAQATPAFLQYTHHTVNALRTSPPQKNFRIRLSLPLRQEILSLSNFTLQSPPHPPSLTTSSSSAPHLLRCVASNVSFQCCRPSCT